MTNPDHPSPIIQKESLNATTKYELPPIETLAQCREITRSLNLQLEQVLTPETEKLEEAIERVHAVIRWVYEASEGKMFVTTSGGETSAVLPHLIKTALSELPEKHPELNLVFINTRYHPPQTLSMVHDYLAAPEAKGGMGFTLHEFGPTDDEIRQINNEHPDWCANPNSSIYQEATYQLKGQPMEEALDTLIQKLGRNLFWLRAIRDYQTQERFKASVLEPGPKSTRLHPLLYWDENRVWEYIAKYKLKTNPYHFDPTKATGECPINLVDRPIP